MLQMWLHYFHGFYPSMIGNLCTTSGYKAITLLPSQKKTTCQQHLFVRLLENMRIGNILTRKHKVFMETSTIKLPLWPHKWSFLNRFSVVSGSNSPSNNRICYSKEANLNIITFNWDFLQQFLVRDDKIW